MILRDVRKKVCPDVVIDESRVSSEPLRVPEALPSSSTNTCWALLEVAD
jgi:hypothetical protein